MLGALSIGSSLVGASPHELLTSSFWPHGAPASGVKLPELPDHGARTRSFHYFGVKRVDSGRLSQGAAYPKSSLSFHKTKMVRSSLGRAVLVDSGLVGSEEYPFYGISVPDFLALTDWLPHEVLKASGKVKQMGEADEVIFVSHQWTSFSHPDPAGNQLRALQTQIRTLSKGKTAVKSDYMLDGGYQYSMLTTGKEWAKQLPNMYIWLDYCCIPQPGAAAGGVHAAQHSDHREGEGDLVAQLKAAVNSIPSYLARSTMMWILVPPVKHESLEGAICDHNSWRRRGWCRLEFAASKLCAGDDMPCMVITSATATPEYCAPCDIFKLCAGRGDFTVDSDRDAVNDTLTKMLRAKVDSAQKIVGLSLIEFHTGRTVRQGRYYVVAAHAGLLALVRAAPGLLRRRGLRRAGSAQIVSEVAQ